MLVCVKCSLKIVKDNVEVMALVVHLEFLDEDPKGIVMIGH